MGLLELISECLDFLIGDGSVLGLGDRDEFVEVVPLDLAGNGSLGWGLGFGHLALVTLVGLAVLRVLGRP